MSKSRMLRAKIVILDRGTVNGGNSFTKRTLASVVELEDISDALKQTITQRHLYNGATSSIDWKKAKKYYIKEARYGIEFWLVHRPDAEHHKVKFFACVHPKHYAELEFALPIAESVIQYILGLLDKHPFIKH